ncbi:MAG: 30S ribosomal protein S20 [Paracoccaceae bacterium]
MANTPQARKRVRQNQRRADVNQARKSRVRTFIRYVEEAIRRGDRDAALLALKNAQPEIMRGANKGVMHQRTASRKVSRLHQRIAKIGAAG